MSRFISNLSILYFEGRGRKKMGFIHWANSIVKKFNIVDVFLIELSSLAFGVLLAVLIPSLLEINVWWIALAVIILAIKPTYKACVGP